LWIERGLADEASRRLLPPLDGWTARDMVGARIMNPSQPGSAPPHHAPLAERSPAPPGGVLISDYLARITPRAWVTPTIAALIVVAFVFELARGVSAMKPTTAQLLAVGGSFGPAVAKGEWWRTLSAMFLHAGLLHIGLNLWAFLSVGRFVERIFGNVSFLALYLLGGFAGELASLAVHPMAVGVGASGAIFSVYGSLLAFGLVHKGVFPREVLRKQRSSLLAFVGYNVVFGVMAPGVDIAAHAGGFVAGMAAGALLNRDLLHPAAHRLRRTLGGIGLAAVLLLAAFGVEQRLLAHPAIRADRLWQRAHLREREGRLADSLSDYRALVAIAPGTGEAWNNLAWVEVVGGDFAAARADADRAVSLEPDSGNARGTRCFALAGLGLLEQAHADCARAVELSNNAIDRGMLAFLDQRYDDARREWEDASRDPTQARALETWVSRLPSKR
jgi:membrane associated rhomboid family serine protease